MKQATLIFLLRGKKIVLAMKKRGFGAGKWNGYGGKVEAGETPVRAAVRELFEESGIVTQAEKLLPLGIIEFEFLEKKDWDQNVHIFLLEDNGAEPVETEEMRPQWFETNSLPFSEMWEDDKYWFSYLLAKKEIVAKFSFVGEGKIKEISITKPELKRILL